MDREYYNSLQEAYNLVERGPTGGYKDAKVKIQNIFKRGAGGGQGNKGRNSSPAPKPTPAKPTPVAAKPDPKVQPRSTGSTAPGTPGRMVSPKPQAAAKPDPKPTPKPQPKETGISGTSASGSPIKTSDVKRRNAATADRAAKVRASGGDPTAGGEFKTKVTDTGSDRLNKALSGIGKWNEETLLAYAEQLVEENYCDTIESALIVIQHLTPETLDEALG